MGLFCKKIVRLTKKYVLCLLESCNAILSLPLLTIFLKYLSTVCTLSIKTRWDSDLKIFTGAKALWTLEKKVKFLVKNHIHLIYLKLRQIWFCMLSLVFLTFRVKRPSAKTLSTSHVHSTALNCDSNACDHVTTASLH